MEKPQQLGYLRKFSEMTERALWGKRCTKKTTLCTQVTINGVPKSSEEGQDY